MAVNQKMVMLLIFCFFGQIFCLPAPQLSNKIPGTSFNEDAEYEYEDDEYYYTLPDDDDSPPALPDLSGLLAAIGAQIPNLMNLIQTKVSIINNILNDKEFQERAGEAIQVGANLVTRVVIPVASRAIPVAIDLVGRAPQAIGAVSNLVQSSTNVVNNINRTPEFQKASSSNTEEVPRSFS